MEDATFTHLVLGYILLCWHFGFLSRYIPLSVHVMSRRHSVCGGRTSLPHPRGRPHQLASSSPPAGQPPSAGSFSRPATCLDLFIGASPEHAPTSGDHLPPTPVSPRFSGE